MSVQLGQSYTPPLGNDSSIVIPASTAPQKQLQLDTKQQVASSSIVVGDTYKFLATALDSTPGFLSAKITTGEFSVVSNKLKLVGFGDLTTADLTEDTNLYWTQTRFNTAFALKDTDDLSEGVTNLYYSSSLFDTDFSGKTTTDLTEGTNLYFTNLRATNALASHTSDTTIHFSDLSGFTTDDLAEGGTNKYLTTAISDQVTLNTAARHTHTNKVYLDAIDRSGASINSAVDNSHTHSNKAVLDATSASFTTALKAQYDAYTSGIITSVVSPLNLLSGVLTHLNTDGNKHVPSNSGAAQYAILSSGASAGTYSWIELETIIANSTVFDATPSTSTTTGVQAAYINSLVTNAITDVKHVTDANLTYINTTIPAHIADTLLHIPTITPTTDQGKFLWVNTSDEPEWTDSTANITTSGSGTYITASGSELTVDIIDISDTNITAGDNITIVDNVISATPMTIDTYPVTGNTDHSISSDWAYDHSVLYGNSGHIPTIGTTNQFLAWDGTFKDVTEFAGTIDVLDYALAMQEDNTLDPGISPTTGDRYIILDSANLNGNFGVITGVGDNDIVEFDGANFVVSFDASATIASVSVTVTLDINGNADREWYYSYSGSEWRDRGLSSSIYWTRGSETVSPATVGDDILLPTGDKLAWDTGVSYITASATNIIGVYIASTETLQINATNIISNVPISVDTIVEKTSATGVTIDSVLLKDNEVTSTIVNITSSATRIQKDGSNNMTFTDVVSGTKTLAELIGTGSVTSVAMTVPTGLAISGSPITTSGTLALAMDTGYAIPTSAKQTEWDTAYTNNLRWDGGSTSLVAATGRTSLGLILGVNVQSYTQIPQALTQSTSTLTMDIASGYNARVTLTESVTTFTWSTAATAGDSGVLTVIQNGTGGWTLALPSGHLTEGGSLTLSTAASSKDILGWYYDGTNYFWNLGKAFA